MEAKSVELAKASGFGSLGVIAITLLWNIQATMTEQKEDLSRLIHSIDKRVAVLEFQRQK
ncbi:hypothetical protein [Shewanella marina]|uniref:hypothetical protein n=1 Tax=Shewanella marina TaxID=487319 RepID=UPI0004700FBF|nr:hypothetical protein [Shewanella marina]